MVSLCKLLLFANTVATLIIAATCDKQRQLQSEKVSTAEHVAGITGNYMETATNIHQIIHADSENVPVTYTELSPTSATDGIIVNDMAQSNSYVVSNVQQLMNANNAISLLSTPMTTARKKPKPKAAIATIRTKATLGGPLRTATVPTAQKKLPSQREAVAENVFSSTQSLAKEMLTVASAIVTKGMLQQKTEKSVSSNASQVAHNASHTQQRSENVFLKGERQKLKMSESLRLTDGKLNTTETALQDNMLYNEGDMHFELRRNGTMAEQNSFAIPITRTLERGENKFFQKGNNERNRNNSSNGNRLAMNTICSTAQNSVHEDNSVLNQDSTKQEAKCSKTNSAASSSDFGMMKIKSNFTDSTKSFENVKLIPLKTKRKQITTSELENSSENLNPIEMNQAITQLTKNSSDIASGINITTSSSVMNPERAQLIPPIEKQVNNFEEANFSSTANFKVSNITTIKSAKIAGENTKQILFNQTHQFKTNSSAASSSFNALERLAERKSEVEIAEPPARLANAPMNYVNNITQIANEPNVVQLNKQQKEHTALNATLSSTRGNKIKEVLAKNNSTDTKATLQRNATSLNIALLKPAVTTSTSTPPRTTTTHMTNRTAISPKETRKLSKLNFTTGMQATLSATTATLTTGTTGTTTSISEQPTTASTAFIANRTTINDKNKLLLPKVEQKLLQIGTLATKAPLFLASANQTTMAVKYSTSTTITTTAIPSATMAPVPRLGTAIKISTANPNISVPATPTVANNFIDTITKTLNTSVAELTAAATVIAATTMTSSSSSAWPVKHASVMEGEVILGGLMMVHSREDSITCGPIMPQGGIQALEAMLYTLDQVNKQQLLPNITLGAHILDDCDKDTYGLEMAVDFIKGSISNIDDAEYHCNKTQVRKVISGVVGAASSVTSIQVANLLRLFRIPQVSFFSTSPELSNKQRFEYFTRTIPSDHYQVKAMVEIVKRMGWSYVSIIYEESNYGIKAFEELEELLARHSICIAIKEKLVKDSGVAEEIAYDNIVQKLLTKPRARGAIIFGSDQEVREVMRAVRRNNATGAFSWIGSDGWSARNLVSDGNEPEVEGTLSVQPQANPVRGFEEYFLNLTVENNQRNPWFVEFWEDHFQCRYPGSFSTPYNNYNRTCTTKEKLSRENTDFEDQLQFVSDAVMAFAYALRDMHRALCGGKPLLCDAMKPTKGADLLRFLRKVEFQGLSGDEFRFDMNGDGPARYNIIHFKQSAEGQYHWVKVGEYYEGELRLNMSEVQFKLLHPKPPESVCSLPCERGQAKKYVEGESCCWHCFNCSMYQIRHPNDETQCLTCKLGTLPDISKQFCQTIPEVYLRPESAWAIGAMAFSATGILVTLFVVGVFVRHNDTPIVRASGRELSYILLAGILMCYAVTFALVLKPTNIVCAIQRFSVGFCFTVVYAALLTKTNRIARIFKAGKQSAKRPSFISPKSQLVICSFFIFVQILINGVWMVIAPSHAMYHHPTREDNLLVCDSYIDASYMIAFFYPIVLIVICTVYAVLTRKIPEAFNESKHIGFTMYTTCVIWLAFVPLYFGTANHVPLRITSMSVTISLSASVTIACLFSPKLYIILIRPERNVRQSMMPPRYANMHRTAGTGPSSMMAAAVVTAATCAQEEKIQKHITPTNTEHNCKAKKLCEMATQTIAISNIFTNIDSSTYNQIPYADQFVPTNHRDDIPSHKDKEKHVIIQEASSQQIVVANNNKINQQQHGQIIGTTAATPSATIVTTINGAASITPLGNHIMLQQHTTTTSATSCDNDCNRIQTATTSL